MSRPSDSNTCVLNITPPQVTKGYLPTDDGLQKTLEGCDIVVIPAGLPRTLFSQPTNITPPPRGERGTDGA